MFSLVEFVYTMNISSVVSVLYLLQVENGIPCRALDQKWQLAFVPQVLLFMLFIVIEI